MEDLKGESIGKGIVVNTVEGEAVIVITLSSPRDGGI